MATAARSRARRLVRWPLLAALIVALYYAIGGHLAHRVDTDPDFAASVDAPDNGSRTIAVLAALVEREVDEQGWVANDPWFLPSAPLDDMASFQTALVATAQRRVDDLTAFVADGAPNADLETARGALAAPGDRWTFDFARGWAPQQTSEQLYREGVAALRRLNAAAAGGGVALDRSATVLATMLDHMASELDAAAAANRRHVAERGGHWLDLDVDDRFMTTRGETFAHLVVLQGLSEDFAAPLDGAGRDVRRTEAALAQAAALDPWLVVNGPADGQWRPSHLAAQAAYVLTAAREMRALHARVSDAGA